MVLPAGAGRSGDLRYADGPGRLRRIPGDPLSMDAGLSALSELAELEEADGFVRRHIGPSESELTAMLHVVGAATLDAVAAMTVPESIRTNRGLDLPPPIDEAGAIAEL